MTTMRWCRRDVAGLPGAELVCAGLDVLEALAADSTGQADDVAGRRCGGTGVGDASASAASGFTIEALLVAVGASRLRRAGLRVPTVPGWPAQPELALYEAVAAQNPAADAHSRYNALIRRLVSFERALEQRAST